jgi:hypothetical protein
VADVAHAVFPFLRQEALHVVVVAPGWRHCEPGART